MSARSSASRTAARSLGVLAPLAVSLLLAAPPAHAAVNGFTSPTTDNTVFTSGASLPFTAVVPKCSVAVYQSCPTVTLTVTGPDGALAPKSATESRQTASSITVSVPVGAGSRNGTGTAVRKIGSSTDSLTFFTNFAPATPQNLAAKAVSQREMSLTWSRGSEPDLLGYVLQDGDGNVIEDLDLSHCNASSCEYIDYHDNTAPGTYGYDYELASKRASCGSACGDAILSTRRASASGSLTTPAAPPTATPSPTPTPGTTTGGTGTTTGGTTTGGTTTGGSTTGGTTTGGTTTGGTTTGGSTTGGSTGSTAVKPGSKPALPTLADAVVAQRRAFALNFSKFSPSLGIPKLPPLPATTLPSLNQPLPLGTFKPTLPYQPGSETTKTTSLISQPLGAVRNVLDSAQLARSIAAALILLLIGGHLRRFLGSHVED